MPNKLLGQHFLKNPHVAQTIVRALDPRAGEIIFEIGPGHGELTLALAEAAKNAGAKVVAIEKDPALAETLSARIDPDVEIIAGDALKILAEEISKRGAENFKIAGNIPYYLSGHLLRTISELQNKPSRVIFTVQKEVAERIIAAPAKMNRLAASVQFWATPKIIGRIPKEDFDPMPHVDSAIISLDRAEPRAAQPEKYYELVRAVFAQPRKTIFNNIASHFKNFTRPEIENLLEKCGIQPGARPQNLSVKDIVSLAQIF